MKLIILNNSNVPLYMQLYDQIVAAIVNEELATDESLPSIRGIAKELGISIITVKNAYDMLEANNYIYTLQGKGCFVAKNNPSYQRDKIAKDSLLKELEYLKTLGFDAQDVIKLIKELDK